MRWLAFGAIEVRLAFVLVKVSAAFDGDTLAAVGTRCLLAMTGSISLRTGGCTGLGSHLGALLAQDCLARELDAIAFDGQNLHQDLIAFVQLVAHVLDAVLGNLADVQQAIGSREDFDECSKIC